MNIIKTLLVINAETGDTNSATGPNVKFFRYNEKLKRIRNSKTISFS